MYVCTYIHAYAIYRNELLIYHNTFSGIIQYVMLITSLYFFFGGGGGGGLAIIAGSYTRNGTAA